MFSTYTSTRGQRFESSIADHILMPKRFESAEERRAYWRQWYENNKHREDYKAADRATKKRIRKERKGWFVEFRKTLKCNRCPENDWAVLDFHHSDPEEKDMEVSTMVSHAWSKEKILKEISKCEVLCSNCHRKHHRDEREQSGIVV